MDEVFLLKALELAKTREGQTAPNPSVGAVVVRDGRILAQGFHSAAGKAHAEVEAFSALQESAEGATLYVSLEPCCHFGKTPPCTDAVIAQKIRRVVYGFKDPNPKVSGGGEARLRAAGIECQHQSVPAIDTFYAPYAHWTRHQVPFVTAKLALSAQGCASVQSGERVTITGERCQTFTHQQRRSCDAILTTVQTANQDDPALNIRLAVTAEKKRVYVLDKDLTLNASLRLIDTAETLHLLHSPRASAEARASWERRGAICREVGLDSEGHLNWEEVLRVLGHDGVHHLWVEAGAKLFSSLSNRSRLQRALLYWGASKLEQGVPAFPQGISSLFGARSVQWQDAEPDRICEMRF